MRPSPSRLLAVGAAVFVYLMVANAFVFPIVFPEGLAEEFVNLRPAPFYVFHVLAFATTAALLSWLVMTHGQDQMSLRKGASTGAILGLLVALPEHLHLYAMVDAPATQQFVPVLWILVIWGVAGLLVVLICHRLEKRGS